MQPASVPEPTVRKPENEVKYMRKKIIALLLSLAMMLPMMSVFAVALPTAGAGSSSSGNKGTSSDVGSAGKWAQEMQIGDAFHTVASQYEKGSELSESVDPNQRVWTVIRFEGESAMEKWKQSGSALPFTDWVRTDEADSVRKAIAKTHETFRQEALNKDLPYTFGYSYTLLTNGLAAEMPYGSITDVVEMPGVSSVRLAQSYSLPDSNAASQSYTASGSSTAVGNTGAGAGTYDGTGTFVAIIDSALDTNHPAFSGDNIDMASAKASAESVSSILRNLDSTYFFWYAGNYEYLIADADDLNSKYNVYKNPKVVYAYDYGDNNTGVIPQPAYLAQMDHGTHTTGILTGYVTDSEGNVTFSGALPQAQIAFMKVFTEGQDGISASDTAIAAAIEDSIMLGVDAINLSLGSPCGFAVARTDDNLIATLSESAASVGISVQVAAGNSFSSAYAGVSSDYPLAKNPDYGSVTSPASYGYTLAVGSYDGNKTETYRHYFDFNGYKCFYTETEDFSDMVALLGEGMHEWTAIRRGIYSDFAGVNGKVCVVFLNDEVRIEVQYVNAYRNGAKAVLFVDNEYRVEAVGLQNAVHYDSLPYCYISRADGELLTHNLSTLSGEMTVSQNFYGTDLMSIFSAWGCTNALTLKPEIVAVGGQVWSTLISEDTYTKLWGPNTSLFNMDYGYMSGTSMASPLMTGYVVQMRQYLASIGIRDALEQQKIANALLMSTATVLTDINGNVYSPRYQGAGAVDVAAALNTTAYLEVVGSEKPKAELGDDPDKTGEYTVDFRVVNTGSEALTYTLDLITLTDSLMPDGKTNALASRALTDTVWNASVKDGSYDAATRTLTVPANTTATVLVKLALTDAAKAYMDANFENGTYVEGYVTLSAADGGVDLSLPYLAFYGDWDVAPIMDASAYEDTPASIFASYILGVYNHGYSAGPLGYYPYTVPEGYADREYDKNLISIGGTFAAGAGGFYSIYGMYYGMLRNAERVQYTISNAKTGEVYTNYTVEQISRAAYSASAGSMYPVMQKFSFGNGLPTNTEVTVSVRAFLGYESDDQNTENSWSVNVFIDDEKPKLYSNDPTNGIENGIVYDSESNKYKLVINVYDNHYLSCVWLTTYDEAGNLQVMDSPIPVDTETFRPGERNRLEIDVTPYMDSIMTGKTMGVILEDGSRLKASFSIPLTGITYESEKETNKTVPAEIITADENVNLSVGFSSDLGVKTVPAYAKYEMISDNEEIAYIDAEKGLVVARGEGEATITIRSEKTAITRKVYVYRLSNEWQYELLTAQSTNFTNDPANIGKAVIKKYYGDGTHVEVPKTVPIWNEATGRYDDVEVCSVDPYAFAGAGMLQYVWIPNTVKLLAWYSFYNCYSLEKLEFEPGSQLVSIGTHAFAGCASLKEFFIPKTVRAVTTRDGLTATAIGMSAFNGCYNMKKLTFEEGSMLTAIDPLAFTSTGIESIDLPESIKVIGSSAFSNCTNLKSFTAPSALTELGSDAFAYCSALETVDLSAATVTKIDSSFRYCSSLRRVYGTGNVTAFGAQAFTGCSELTYVEMTDVLTKIGMFAFRDCTKLTEIYLGDAMRTVDKEAFENCVSLRTIRIGKGADLTFGVDALTGCTALENITVHPANPNHMSVNGVLYSKDTRNSLSTEGEQITYWILHIVPMALKLKEFTLRADVTSVAQYAFAYHSELESFFIPEGSKLMSIGAYAFAGCMSLSYINLENAKELTGIGNYCFTYNIALTDITLPCDGIGVGMFNYCVNLKNINIPSTLSSIAAYGLAYCIRFEGFNGEKGVTLPESLSTLSENAFLFCRNIEYVDLSACSHLVGSTNYWGEYAFANCFNLKKVIFNPNVQLIGQYGFYNCTALEEVNFSDLSNLERIGSYAFASCTSLKQADLADGIRIIGSYAFAGCEMLSQVNLPESLGGIYSGGTVNHQIQPYAFAGCKSLTHVTLPWNLKVLQEYVFAESGLQSITIPGNMNRGGVAARAFYLCNDLEEILVDDQRDEDTGAYVIDENGNHLPSLYYQSIDGVLATKLYQLKSGNRIVTEYPAELLVYPAAKAMDVYTIPDGFDTIPTGFFFMTGATRKVVIPESVKNIAVQAFYCADINEVEFAADSAVELTDDLYGIFMNCKELRRVVLPENLTMIPEGTFYECSSLETVENTANVKTFGYMSFYDCTKLQSIDLSSAESIQDAAFAFCESLTEVHLSAAASSVSFSGTTAFAGCTGLRYLSVDPSNRYYMSVDNVIYNKEGTALYLYPAAREDKTFTVPQDVARIGAFAFAFNENLETVILPESVLSIGYGAFIGTLNLSTYVMKSPVVPLLDGVSNSDSGMLIYASFYGMYYDPSDIYMTLVRPAGADTYDNQWVYRQCFDLMSDLEDPIVLDAHTGEKLRPELDLTPVEIAVTSAGYSIKRGEETVAVPYTERFNAYVDALITGLGSTYSEELEALKTAFAEELECFASVLTESDRAQLYRMWCAEADLIADGNGDLYVLKWNRIHDLMDYASYLVSTFAYLGYTPDEETGSQIPENVHEIDFRGDVTVIAGSALTVISNCTSAEDIHYWHDVYRAMLDSIPKYNDVDAFWNYRQETLDGIMELNRKLAEQKANYSDKAYEYAISKLSDSYMNAQTASCYYMLSDALATAEKTVLNLVLLDDEPAFNDYKTAVKQKLDVYRSENYTYTEWYNIKNYIEERKALIDNAYTYSEVYSLLVSSVDAIDACQTILDREKAAAIEKLETAVLYYYDMRNNCSDDVWAAISGLLNDAERAINAVTVTGICETVANSYFDEIWEIYLYNRKVWQAKLTAEKRLDDLSAGATDAGLALIAETQEKLNAVSAKNSGNYDSIVAIMTVFDTEWSALGN